ncbi:MAG TPA: DNA polymerase I [Blastocatellia bacterium]|jgi:DNA polymerase-1|nr:DNA polymerase I [Blastocatellia bacterium]
MSAEKRKRLYIVDGMSQLYRAYYAIRGLSTSTGIPTNAIYGFTMMLRRLINEEKPDYLGVAFDTSGPTFRHDSYAAYKATRTGMPEDLAVQLKYLDRLLEALRVPVTRAPGFEADDIIGTLAAQAEQAGVDMVIVTNDKDMCQLVTDQVKILKTARDGSLTMLDARAVQEKMGVRPDQVIDLLALWGDTSDNIPGAPGVGEKGAQQIIQQFETLENALAHADEISRKTYRESLKNNVDMIRQSRDLVTIKCDMPIKLDLNGLIYEAPDRHAAYELFSELEFAALKKEFADAATSSSIAAATQRQSKTRYTRITTRAALDELIASLWAVDSFALSVEERDEALCGFAIASEPGKAGLIDLQNFESGSDPLAVLKEVLENGLIRKSIQDWKGALTLLDRYVRGPGELFQANGSNGSIRDFEPAIRIEGVEDDTMLAAYLLDPNRTTYRILEIARERIGIEMAETAEGFDAEDLRALQTADLTLQLAGELRERIEEAGLDPLYRQIELPLVEILFEMERIGVRIDTRTLEQAGREMEKELERLTREIYEQAGCEFNINSTHQLGEIFEKLNFGVGRKTKTGRISTSVDVLEELAAKYELPRLIIDYRELAKLKNTYVDALPRLIDPRSGRIHTTLNQAVSATGRLSSTNPNLQNIPIRSEQGRRIRAAFVASPGYVLMSADYSQIELRLFAHITGDPVMTEAFKKGEDIHAKTAREVFGATTKQEESEARRLAKIVNFAIPYVIGPFGLAQRTGLSRADAKKAIADYYETYKEVRRYMEETPEQVRQTGVVRTIFGRIRPIPDIQNRNHNLRARAEREAINAPIQGSAADLVKIAMIRVHDRLKREGLRGLMMLQVHDELLLEVPEGEIEPTRDAVREEMEAVYPLAVPLVVDIGVGKNWVEAKP